MPHFLINSQNIIEGSITLKEPDLLAHIVGALRIKAGETIKLIDENKIVHLCKIEEVSKKCVVASVLSEEESKRFLPFKITLVQGVLKPDAQTLAVANATQMGVSDFLPVVMDNSALNLACVSSKQEKWQKIADEAFKQCERADLMNVLSPVSNLEKALEGAKNVVVFAEREANISLGMPKGDIIVVIGPEGGFSEREFEFFKRQNYSLVSIGNLILKAPNAIVAGLAQITYERGKDA